MAITDVHEGIVKKIERVTQAVALSFFLAINPVPASRPRVTRWGTYYGKVYTKFKIDAEMTLKDMAFEPVDGPCILCVDMRIAKPRTSKLTLPRGDVDNYLKAIMDAMTKAGAWKDDDQVVTVLATKRFALPEEDPGFGVTVHTLTEI